MLKVAVYGVGYGFEQFMRYYYRNADMRILHVVDSDADKWGRILFWQYPVESPEVLKKHDLDFVVVTILNRAVIQEVRGELHDTYAIPYENIVSLYELVTADGSFEEEDRNDGGRMVPVKLYDCFPFFNELDLLELRLELLEEVVDYFVLVEMERTHQGKKKELYFDVNKERYRKWSDKIIHVILREHELPAMGEIIVGGRDWTLENYQRNGILKGLDKCSAKDLVVISDLDEMPEPDILKEIKREVCEGRGGFYEKLNSVGAVTLETLLCIGYINCISTKRWLGSIVQLRKRIRTPQHSRDFRGIFPRIENAGWHFSWMGSREQKLLKAGAIVEGERVPNQQVYEVIEKMILGEGMPHNQAPAQIFDTDECGFPKMDLVKKRYPYMIYENS